MLLSERIQQCVQRLPASSQAEVLDFVQYLLSKTERDIVQQEIRCWSSMSLSSAVHGMEDENAPTYTASDLKVVFS